MDRNHNGLWRSLGNNSITGQICPDRKDKTMSLSKRLYEAQVKKDKPVVDDWNKRLAEEIERKKKEAKRAI